MSAVDIAWAAGLFEGEGCVYAVRRPSGLYVRVQVKMTDEDVVRRMQEVLGGSVSGPNRPPSAGPRRKPTWHWSCTGSGATHALELLLPHLGGRRRARAQQVIEQVNQRKENVQ